MGFRFGPVVRVTALLLAGCAGGEDDAPAAAESGVPGDTRLADLSEADAVRVCTALSERLGALVSPADYRSAACVAQAWPLSASISNITGELELDVAKCDELAAKCEAKGGALGENEPAQGLGEDLVDLARCSEPAPGLDLVPCEATVGQLEACSRAFTAELDRRLPLLVCESLRDPEAVAQADGVGLEPESLEGCEALAQSCPGLALDARIDGMKPGAL